MNASIPKDSEIREAIASILTTHSLDELTFERVYMLLEASFVVPLSAKRDQIKIQLEILLYKVFVDYAAASSPGKTYPSPERSKDREKHKQPIKKLLQHRLSEINKKRSTDLSDVIESVTTVGMDPRFPPERIFQAGGGPESFWISSGLYPQVLHVRFACPVCLEKVSFEATSVQRLRIECRRVPKAEGHPREFPAAGGTEAARGVWNDDVVTYEKIFEDYSVGPDDWAPAPVQACDIFVNFVFTQLLLITVVEGFRDFCTLRKVSVYGIKIDLLGVSDNALQNEAQVE